MAFVFTLLTLLIRFVWSEVQECADSSFNSSLLPEGIGLFNHIFDLEANDELQTLQNAVLNNRCNFGAPNLSSSIFSFASGYVNLHCGAYGSQPKYVVKYHDHIRNILYSRPHLWDNKYFMDILRKEIANYLGIHDTNDLVFVINTSHGINAVIRSVMDNFLANYKNNLSIANCSIIYFNTAHPAFLAPLQYYQSLWNVNLIEIQFDKNILQNYDSIISMINDTLITEINSNRTILFTVFSHITSLPSVILPVKDICQLLHQYNIISIVDAAHAIGQIYNINISDLNCDIYISNAYKWFYSVWNTAVLYVNKKYQNIIKPSALASYHINNASYQELFDHPGSIDKSAYLSLMGSLKFRYLIGGDQNIINYIHQIAIQTQIYLSNKWNTTIFISNEQYYAGMVNILLPSGFTSNDYKRKMNEIFSTLLESNDIAIKLFEWNNEFFIRICCQIYTNMDQISLVGDLILEYITSNKLLKQEL